jgi:hypothetical protein
MKRALLLSTFALGACQQADKAPDEAAATPTPTPSEASLSLDPLQDGDGKVVADSMNNVGGCAFYDDSQRLLLSVGIPDNYGRPVGAGGDAIGVARVNGAQTKLTAEKGDASYVEAGPKLNGGGYTLTVLRAQGEGKTLDREEVEYMADLTVSAGNGVARTYTAGRWRCGV